MKEKSEFHGAWPCHKGYADCRTDTPLLLCSTHPNIQVFSSQPLMASRGRFKKLRMQQAGALHIMSEGWSCRLHLALLLTTERLTGCRVQSG